MGDTQELLSNILSLGDWATWQDSIHQVEASLKPWMSRSDASLFRRIYLVGCGSSFYAGQVSRYVVERLTHLPTEAKQAFSFTHYCEPALLGKDVLVVGVSSTGNTAATCSALAFARQHGAATLAITQAPDSKIAQIAHDTLWMGGGDTVLVKTRSYVQSLVALYGLAVEISEETNPGPSDAREYWRNQFRIAYEITRRFLDTQQAQVLDLVEAYQSAHNIFILGSGPNVGTAEEGALKVIEMAKMVSDGCDMEDFFHGREREVVEDSAIFFLAPQNIVVQRMLDFLTFNRKVGISSVVLACKEIPELPGLTGRQLSLEGGLDELASPLVYITPLYLFSYHMALKRGFSPVARRHPMGALYVQYQGSEYDISDYNN